ncbi:hypothetical protein DL96DRAFT_1810692 [Flagelloscypha sp. PMI_526]|nr:hypothetical protein DL96DRAFT_1810692 [Flagelloscypha sp. PMI_526]
MNRVELPLDILDRCIQLVPFSEQATLLSCALAGRILRPSCQRALFASASFFSSPDDESELTRWKQFCDALNTFSDLGQHVRYLSLSSAQMNDETLLPVFSKTRNLRRLTFFGGFGRRCISWAQLQPQTQRVLQYNVFPHLIHLRLYRIHDIPAIIFESLLSLRSLECSDSIVELDPSIQTEPGPNPRHLNVLKLHSNSLRDNPSRNNMAPIVNYLTRYQCRLQIFDLDLMYFPAKSLSDLTRLISLSNLSLQDIRFCNLDDLFFRLRDESAYNRWFDGVFDLKQYRSLTSFVAMFTLYQENLADQKQFIQRFAQILHSGRPTLTSPGLKFILIDMGFSSARHRHHDRSFWSPIVDALSAISTLEKVTFEICLWREMWGSFRLESKDPIARAKARHSLYLPWKLELEAALNNAGLCEKSEIILNMDFDG